MFFIVFMNLLAHNHRQQGKYTHCILIMPSSYLNSDVFSYLWERSGKSRSINTVNFMVYYIHVRTEFWSSSMPKTAVSSIPWE